MLSRSSYFFFFLKKKEKKKERRTLAEQQLLGYEPLSGSATLRVQARCRATGIVVCISLHAGALQRLKMKMKTTAN